ncbi:MAG: hypothetical protein OJF51_005161 [Nitrospira sp.]|nr:MAG: hypothetical protein OJF51_005161 [Nitrospira sp.]
MRHNTKMVTPAAVQAKISRHASGHVMVMMCRLPPIPALYVDRYRSIETSSQAKISCHAQAM